MQRSEINAGLGDRRERLDLGLVKQVAGGSPEVSDTSYRDEVTSQATEKEDLEADTAKHSSVLETAVSRSTRTVRSQAETESHNTQ